MGLWASMRNFVQSEGRLRKPKCLGAASKVDLQFPASLAVRAMDSGSFVSRRWGRSGAPTTYENARAGGWRGIPTSDGGEYFKQAALWAPREPKSSGRRKARYIGRIRHEIPAMPREARPDWVL